ncbi:MAG TPA: pseudaminic acid synthase [Chroococcales cyanobacterium]|jgi:N-acetylneuraminate synthase
MIRIGERLIGAEQKPFVIAEMSGNHRGSLEVALEIVDRAADCGVEALKIQTYTADTMTLDLAEEGYRIDSEGSLWQGRTLYDLYREAYTPWEWHAAIFERCRERGVIGFSTPFDASAVDFLESLDVQIYKVASFENTDLELIRKVARTGKPLVISTGMATVAELDETVQAAREAGCRELLLLKCTSAYPASPEGANLRTIPHLRELFGVPVGLSDHTLGLGVPLAAVALGACAIEKHFTPCRADGGVDAAFSLEPAEMRELVVQAERAWQALGSVRYGRTEAEREALRYRRSLYFVRDLQKGEVIAPEAVRAIRPGFGLPVKFRDLVIGRTLKKDVRRGMPVSWDSI